MARSIYRQYESFAHGVNFLSFFFILRHNRSSKNAPTLLPFDFMKNFALIFLLFCLIPSKSRATTFFTEGARRQFNQQAYNDLDMSSIRAGILHNGDGFGIWGEVERFFPDNYNTATNSEISALKNLGPFNLLLGFGHSDDFHFKPSHLYLAEIQVPTSIGLTPYFGASKEDYEAPIVNKFVYYKVGAVKTLSDGFSLLFQYQFIDNQNTNRTINKIGSQLASSLTYSNLNQLMQIGAQFSCTGNSASCDKSKSRDEYFESNFIYRWWVDSQIKTFGLRGQVTYVYQKSFFIRETSSEIGRSSWTFRLGPQFEF